MAQISEYQRENLKSSQVGTPGVDNSTGQALDSIAQASGQVADASYQLAVKRKAAKDEAVANESILGMDVDMENSLRDHQTAMKDFQGDPKERAGIFKTQAEKMVQERAKLAPNEEVRRAITENGLHMVQSRTQREIEAADKNQGMIAYVKINDAQKLAEEEAARVGADENMSFGDKMKRMDDLLARQGKTVDVASLVLDPKQTQEFRVNSPAGIMKAAATGMLAKKPEELLALIDKKDAQGKSPFESYLSPTEIASLKKEATDSLLNFQKRKEREEVEAHLQQVSGAFDLAKKGDSVGALAMTEALADGPLKTSMRQSILREGITESDRTDKVYDIMTKFSTYAADKKANTKKKKTNMKTSLDELIALQAEVVEAHATGDLTDSKRNEYLTEFLPDMQKKVKENSWEIKAAVPDSQTGTLLKVWGGIKGITQDKTEVVNIHEDFRRRLVMGRDFTPAGVNKALIGALDEHRKNRFPKSMFLATSVNAVLDHDKSLIATGVQGRTDSEVSGKVAPAVKTIIETDVDTQKKYKVTYDASGNKLSETEING